jgi:hypothetical protein
MSATQDQLLRAYENAPEPIQEALTDGLAISFILKLRSRYALHVDTTDTVTQNIRNMVLGLMTPSDFLTSLSQLGIPDDTARKLTADLNQEVFIPLRDQVRKEQPSLQAPQQPKNLPLVTRPRVTAPVQNEIAETSKAEVPPFNLIRPSEPVRTMGKDIALIKATPQRPAIEKAAPAMTHTMQPEHATPARVFQTASIPVRIPEPATPPMPIKAEIKPTKESSSPTSDNPIVKEYTADPYREPI